MAPPCSAAGSSRSVGAPQLPVRHRSPPHAHRRPSTSHHAALDRFLAELRAIVAAGVGVDLFVYTPEEFGTLLEEERPFVVHALDGARVIHEG